MAKEKVPKAGTPLGHRIRLPADGRIIVNGIDFETKDITVLARHDKAIVLRVGARTCWNGHSVQRIYRSPLIMVYKIINEIGDELLVEPVIQWEITRKPGAPRDEPEPPPFAPIELD